MRYAIILSINIQIFSKNSRFSEEYKLFSGAPNFFQASKCKFPFCVLHFLLSSQAHAAARRAVENRRICIREFAERRIRGNSGGFGTRTVSEAALHDIPLLGSAFFVCVPALRLNRAFPAQRGEIPLPPTAFPQGTGPCWQNSARPFRRRGQSVRRSPVKAPPRLHNPTR